jgi:predicted nucleotidyltransferase
VLAVSESTKAALDSYVKYISSLEGVLQIYLFGSYANGTAHERSDIDLMVIVDDSLNRANMAIKISKGLANRTVPLDVLVNRKTDFLRASNEPTLQNHIMSEGVLMYGIE